MKSLNDNIKVIGVEAIAGCMFLGPDEHIDEVNTLLAIKELIEYIGFDGSSLTKYAAERFKQNEINAEYVIERYRLPDHQFFYKIFRRNREESNICIGDWRITNIRSANHVDKALYFDLIDPTGKSSEDKFLPYYWVIEGAECNLFSRSLPNDSTGLDDMMNLAYEAARFDNWLDFIKHKFTAIVLRESNLKIEMLTQEVNSFKSNLYNLIKSF
jgi:hypothetical protein